MLCRNDIGTPLHLYPQQIDPQDYVIIIIQRIINAGSRHKITKDVTLVGARRDL
jgi:hypothetical protein